MKLATINLLLFVLLLLMMDSRSVAQFEAMCSPDHADSALRCNCLTIHQNWCSEDIPPPECCRRGEKGSAAVRCGCCRSQASSRWMGKLCSHS